ncbi:MAG: M14 family metallopeptidase [Bdellovibrionales bacterium]
MADKTTPWGETEKKNWLKEQTIKRSYLDEVVSKIEALKNSFDVIQYGSLSYNPKKYPLFIIKSSDFDSSKKNILITGGVHGYETSGVHGALKFLEAKAAHYTDHFNIIVAPCISPWGYETINRWNPNTVDPNRSFFEKGPSEECNFIMKEVKSMKIDIFAHIDLHETTDTDNSVFRPALEQRDGKSQEIWDIPDGFYLVGDSKNPQSGFQKAMIDSVKKITHIAPADNNGKIIGEPLAQEGVINYPIKKLNLCAAFSNANYCSTTEVYPDSPKANDEDCAKAQVAAICGALDYLLDSPS